MKMTAIYFNDIVIDVMKPISEVLKRSCDISGFVSLTGKDGDEVIVNKNHIQAMEVIGEGIETA